MDIEAFHSVYATQLATQLASVLKSSHLGPTKVTKKTRLSLLLDHAALFKELWSLGSSSPFGGIIRKIEHTLS